MLKVSDNHIVLGGGGGGGSTTFAGLSDKTTADIPAINTPLADALDAKEATSNKKTDVDANKTSDTFFPSVKAVFDWVSGLFVKGAVSSTDNAVVRFDGTTGKVVQNSNVVINDSDELLVGNKLIVTKSVGNNSAPAFKVNGIALSGSGSSDGHGYGFYLSYNLATNRQFVFANTETGQGLRFIGSYFDGFNVITQSQIDLTIGGNISIHNLSLGVLKDSVGYEGADGQVLKKVGGLVIWSNP